MWEDHENSLRLSPTTRLFFMRGTRLTDVGWSGDLERSESILKTQHNTISTALSTSLRMLCLVGLAAATVACDVNDEPEGEVADNVVADEPVLQKLPTLPENHGYMDLSGYEIPGSLRARFEADADELHVFLAEPLFGACYEELDEGYVRVDCVDAWSAVLAGPAGAVERRFTQDIDVSAPQDVTPRGSCYPAGCAFNAQCSSHAYLGVWDYWSPPWGGCLGYWTGQCGC